MSRRKLERAADPQAPWWVLLLLWGLCPGLSDLAMKPQPQVQACAGFAAHGLTACHCCAEDVWPVLETAALVKLSTPPACKHLGS